METRFKFSAVLIVPVNLHADAIALGEALGWGPNNYSVPLYDRITFALSHYGARASVTSDFLGMVANAGSGSLPTADWAAHGLDPARVFAVLGGLHVNFAAVGVMHPRAQFAESLDALGLTLQSQPE